MATFEQTTTSVTEENVIDAGWLSAVLDMDISNVIVEDMNGAGGMSARMRRLRVTTASNEEKTFVLKSTRPDPQSLIRGRQMGLAREGLFFNSLGDSFKSSLPKIYFSFGDMSTGEKFILLEDLTDAVQTGYFFGPGSPLNWGKDLNAEKKSLGHLKMSTITDNAVMLAARIHATYWKQQDLLEPNKAWLRGSEWLKGEGEAVWQGGQAHVRDCWEKAKAEKIGTEGYGVKWHPFVVQIMDASMAKISWLHFQERIQIDPWTLVHGDYHPANMLWRPDDTTGDSSHPHQLHNIVLLDWEVVGLGSGAQDLGQYVISHMSPDDRRVCEDSMMRLYYSQLLSYGTVKADEYTWEKCWGEYVAGGAERWIWLLALLTSMCPDAMVQYFHDQVEAFCRDHGVTTETVGMPRL